MVQERKINERESEFLIEVDRHPKAILTFIADSFEEYDFLRQKYPKEIATILINSGAIIPHNS